MLDLGGADIIVEPVGDSLQEYENIPQPVAELVRGGTK